MKTTEIVPLDSPTGKADPMFNITINITSNKVTHVAESPERKGKRKRVWVAVATWAGMTAATVAVIADALEILERIGLL